MGNNKEYMNAYMKSRYEKRREDAIQHLGGVCVSCGSTQDLQFHHIDKSTKSFTIARGSSRSNELFWNEVEKCVLLCSTCHRTHHTVIHPCGTIKRYWQGCRCLECRRANTQYGLEYRQRRRST